MYSTVSNSCERGASFGDVSMKINKTLSGDASLYIPSYVAALINLFFKVAEPSLKGE